MTMTRRTLLASLAASALPVRSRLVDGTRVISFILAFESCKESEGGAASVLVELVKRAKLDGRNLKFEWLCFGMDFNRGLAMARDSVQRGADVLYTIGTPSTRMLEQATQTIPIACVVMDPVGSGITRSLARPTSNVTGFSGLHPDTPQKEIELLRRILPSLRRLVILGNRTYPGMRELLGSREQAAKAVGLTPIVQLVQRDEFDRLFGAIKGHKDQAALVGWTDSQAYAELAAAALRNRVPTLLYNGADYVELGGLMSFDMVHANREAREVALLDKLLRGIKPAEIPWELPDRSHFAINLRTAKVLGLTVPQDLLVAADQVVE